MAKPALNQRASILLQRRYSKKLKILSCIKEMGCLKLSYQEEGAGNYPPLKICRGLEEKEDVLKKCDDYYPFGLTFNSSERSGFTTNKFLYNGKELQTELNLDWYDYGFRFYDPCLGRWSAIDPLVESYSSNSPYHYALNNPIIYKDILGMGAEEKGKDEEDKKKQQQQESKTEDKKKEEVKASDVTITYKSGASKSKVKAHAETVIKDIHAKAGIKKVVITSTYRSPESQMKAMYNNIESQGVEKQKKLYSSKGDQVIDAYSKAKKEKGATAATIQAAMLKKAKENDFTSAHSKDNYESYNVIDVSFKDYSDKEYKAVRKAADNDKRISKVLGKEEKDPALHLEIPIPKE